MTLTFDKYQGAGNDFIMIDNRSHIFDRTRTDLVAFLCDRRFGIGADGLILLQDKPGYDFEMVYYNADGRESSMCGNGGRCIVAFASQLGIISKQTTFLAVDGVHDAQLMPEEWVSLHMQDVASVEKGDGFYWLNTGSPHYVQFTDRLEQLDIVPEARTIRYNDRFRAEGTNVNFISWSNDRLHIRTYERGVEDETLACGTGVTAAALVWHLHQGGAPGSFTVPVKAQGGNLQVKAYYDIQKGFSQILLEGPATRVFSGQVSIG